MTQLTAAEAARLNRMDYIARKVGLGTRIRALEGGNFTGVGSSAQMAVCDSGGTPTLVSISGAGTISTAGVLKITKIAAVDADASKIFGLVSTRNAADSSMYVPVTDSSGYERGWKVCFAPAANGGGYFESLYVNTKVAASMAGTLRGAEDKVSVTGTANASGEVVASYSKINVETGATVASAIGHDIEIDPEGSATVTAGTGLRVKDSAKWKHAIDVSGTSYSGGAILLPSGSQAGKTRTLLATAFGCAYNSAGASLVGVHVDTGDSNKRYAMFKDGTDFYYVQLTAVGA
jgi:hypothetical protein